MATITGKVQATGWSGAKWDRTAYMTVVDAEKGGKYLAFFADDKSHGIVLLSAAQARNLATKLTKGQDE